MRSVAAITLILGFSSLACGETMEVNPKAPTATFAFPDDWSTSRIDRGIQANTDDEELYIWVETYKPKQLDAVVAEHNRYWKEQGVTITGREVSQTVENGYAVQFVSQKATYEGKPTVIYYLEYDLGLPSRSNILITYWASPEANADYSDEVKAIIDSMEITESTLRTDAGSRKSGH